MKILMIEDDVDFALLVKRRLEGSGHDVTLIHNWLSVMIHLKDQVYDYIVADVETPTGNGLTAFEFLNETKQVRDTPKVFLTGLRDAETVQKCFHLGAMYIHKSPGFLDELDAVFSETRVLKPTSTVSETGVLNCIAD